MAVEELPLSSHFHRARDEWVPRFPTDDPLWESFATWVKDGGVVRRDLLERWWNGAWEIVWLTFAAGASCSGTNGSGSGS